VQAAQGNAMDTAALLALAAALGVAPRASPHERLVVHRHRAHTAPSSGPMRSCVALTRMLSSPRPHQQYSFMICSDGAVRHAALRAHGHFVCERTRKSSVMRTSLLERLLIVFCLLLGAVVCVLSLRGGAGFEGTTTGSSLKNILDMDNLMYLNDIDVSVHIPPEVTVHQPFTVTAIISSRYPLTSLTGSVVSPPSPNPAGTLDQIVRPSASYYTGPYALCLNVQLRLDDPPAFDLPSADEQEFMLVPGVTTVQTAQWTLIPRDPFGVETVAHQATVGVWFDAKTTCSLGTPRLVEAFGLLYSHSQNSAPPVQFTVVNASLRQQKAITAHLQPFAVAAVAAGTIASVGWAAGFFAWLRRRLSTRKKHGASENGTPRSAAKRSWFVDDVLLFVGPRVALVSLGMVLITLGPSTVAYYVGTEAMLGSVYGGMVVACVGIVVLARAVRRLRVAYSS
jgi:hypothetical protein